jgi:hypothetical protein
MTDSPRRDGPEPFGDSYPGNTDPAYASQAPYGPTYQPPAAPMPTERLPTYPPYGYDPYATGQYGPQYPQYPPGEPPQPPPPEGPKSPRWLWIVAAVAVLTVICLVIALVILNSSQQDTVVAPLPSLPEPTSTKPTPTTTSPTPIPVFPLPTLPSTPSTTGPPTSPSTPGATETVVYDVSGDGRAINITYVDTGGVLQTEFNVILPWSKQVELAKPAEDSASVSIINVGREVSCSITVNGVQVQQRTGAGLTICTAAG